MSQDAIENFNLASHAVHRCQAMQVICATMFNERDNIAGIIAQHVEQFGIIFPRRFLRNVGRNMKSHRGLWFDALYLTYDLAKNWTGLRILDAYIVERCG